jgi:phosphoribosylaminoimidazole-succinocarboxamide synthase
MSAHLTISGIEAVMPAHAVERVAGLPFPLKASGKVRDLYDLGDAWLMVASDRLSAFDVVLPTGIPGKGIILTQMSLYWFHQTATLVANHLLPDHPAELRRRLAGYEQWIPRSMVVRKLRPLPVEAVARGYLTGSGWKSYVQTGALFGQSVPPGLQDGAKLPFPYFTPTTKEAVGSHDQPLTVEQGTALLGAARFGEVRDISLQLYALGSAAARKAGLILADTKFEFGQDANGELVLIDELLTPDSSRYWAMDGYTPGRSQASFDKQFVRDYLETLEWDKTAPGPALPTDVIDRTRELYLAAAAHFLG